LDLGGIGTDEYIKLNMVFESLVITNLTSSWTNLFFWLFNWNWRVVYNRSESWKDSKFRVDSKERV